MHIYISGPTEIHAETAGRLTDNGMTVVNPSPSEGTSEWPPPAQFAALVTAEAFYAMPGWAALARAAFERSVADWMGMRIYGARA